MISSKRITFIAVVLVILALIFVGYYYINPPIGDKLLGVVTYENGQSVEYDSTDYYADYTSGVYENILLDGESAACKSQNVRIDNGSITISGGGIYEISGTLKNGSITVNAPDGAVVNLILNGVDITSSNGPAIYIEEASKTVISLPYGTTNVLSDSSSYDNAEIDAVIYSKDNLVFNGTGKLIINANFADALKTNDSLKIIEGIYEITAEDDAINANDYIVISDGDFNLNARGSGVKCENNEDASLGFIAVEGGKFNITSAKDCLHASSDIYVNDIEASLSTEDDAVHTEKNIVLNGGKIEILKCYEGFEGAYITINDGDYNIIAKDDAINATGENSDGMSMPPVMGHRETISEDIYLFINGGKLYAEVEGDGLDSNSAAIISGGYVEVYGPENNGNSTLDFDGGFVINGGTVISAGSSGMAESPAGQSGQNTITAKLSKFYDRDTSFSLKDENGNVLIEGTSPKSFDWICISSDAIKNGSEYTLTVGGNVEAETVVSETVTGVNDFDPRFSKQPNNDKMKIPPRGEPPKRNKN